MEKLTAGDTAPDFALTDKDGVIHTLSKTSTKFTVVYFYPKDNTPGCTIEAKQFSDALEAIQAAGATVFGISGGTDKSKESFCTKQKLTVTLVSDTDFSVSKAFGVYGPKKFMGRTFQGISRTTFILDQRRTVLRIFEKVKAEGHAAEVLAALGELTN